MQNIPLTICYIGRGTDNHTITRIKYFKDLGHNVCIITDDAFTISSIRMISPDHSNIRIIRGMIKFIDFIKLNAFSAMLKKLGRIIDVAKHIERMNPDIIHIHYASGIYAWTAAIFSSRPVVVSTMGGDILFEEQKRSNIYQRSETLDILNRADVITAKSSHSIERIKRICKKYSRIEHVIWGVDFKLFRKDQSSILKDKLNINDNYPVIFVPKSLQPFYNTHVVIESMPEIIKRYPKAILLLSEMSADNEYKDELLKIIDKYKLSSNVKFVGEINCDEMPKYYSIADISISLPESDGFPQSLLEGMACGVPNIITNLSIYTDIVIDRIDAYFVNVKHIEVSKAVLEIMKDDKLRQNLILNAYDTVKKKANCEIEIKRMESIYYDCLSVKINKYSLLRKILLSSKLLLYFFFYNIKKCFC